MRVVIFGNSGSGKSTLARALAERHGLPHLDLDTLAFESDQPGVRRPAEASRSDLLAWMGGREEWVVEGCYADLLETAIASCTQLIFLNPGVETCIANCRARPFEPHKYDSPEAQDQNLEMLIGWVRAYETRDDEYSLAQHRALFDGFEGDKVEHRSNATLP